MHDGQVRRSNASGIDPVPFERRVRVWLMLAQK